jgi:P4 family phage/plasmid primase-like protien
MVLIFNKPKKLMHTTIPSLEEIKAKANALDKNSTSDVIKGVLAMLAQAGFGPLETAMILNRIKSRTCYSVKTLRHELALLNQEHSPMALDTAYGLAQLVLDKQFAGGAHLLRCPDGRYWCYDKTHWRMTSDATLQHVILEYASKLPLPSGKLNSLVNEAKGLIDKMTATDEDVIGLNDDPAPVVNCANGEVWIAADGKVELRPHLSESRLISCLPIEYDPNATCPLFDAALAGIFANAVDPHEMVRHWYEFTGYAIQPRRDIATFWLLIGNGDNGKTSLLQTIQRLAGPDAVFNGQIAKFQSDRFNTAALPGKLLFIDDDVGKNTHLDDGLLKIISEQKEISTRHAYGAFHFKFKCLALPVMAANNYPLVSDNSHGFRRRAMVIPFDRQFKGEEKDTELFVKIWESEMPGILTAALQGLKRVRQRNGFDTPVDCQRALADFMAHANPLLGFIDDICADDPNGHIDLQSFRVRMAAWMSEQGMKKPVPFKTLRRELEGLGYVVINVQGYARVNGLSFKQVSSSSMG